MRGNGAVVDLRLGIEDLHQASERGQSALHQVGHPAQRNHGPDEISQEDIERREGSHADPVREHVLAAHHHQQQESHREEQFHAGPEETGNPDQSLVLRHEVQVHRVELRHLRFLLAEGADHPHAGEVFAHPLREFRIKRLDLLKAFVNLLAEELDPNGYEGHGNQAIQRQAPVQMHHQGNRCQAQHRRVGGIHDARPHHIAHRVQIVGELRHQVAGAVLSVVAWRQAHEMQEAIVAQIVFDIPRYPDQNPSHPESQNGLADGHGHKQSGHAK